MYEAEELIIFLKKVAQLQIYKSSFIFKSFHIIF